MTEAPAMHESFEPRESEHELARKNVRFGLLLFGLFVLLFAGTVVVAFIYLAVD